jgi:putative sigma-54 modulation protein
MNFTITGRNVNVSEKLHDYIEKKIPRLEKYFNQIMETRFILFAEKQDHVAEMVIVGDGVQFYGQEKGGDFYSAVDLLLDKVEKQMVRFKEKHQLHKGIHLGDIPLVDINNDENFQVIVEEASAKPVDEVEAFLEMKLSKRDFFLYKKGSRSVEGKDGDGSDVVMFNDGGSFRLAEIPGAHANKGVLEFDLTVVKDSSTSPELKSVQSSSQKVKTMKINDALVALVSSEKSFVPFFNSETNALNVIFSHGKNIGVLIPASK